MAKEKKKFNIDANIQEAENGFIVRVCHDSSDGPCGESRRFVAKTKDEAQKLMSDALSGKIKPKERKLTTDGPKLGSKAKGKSKLGSKKNSARKKA